jgi:outer membrane protein OmpA-like peptidoglycan-associated protein
MRRILPALLILALPAAAQPAGPLIVEGNAQRRTLDCAGRDVVVRGERNALAFTGGCRSLEVQGNTSEIRAELAPGARVTLRGQTLDFAWSQLGEGAAPRIAQEGQQIRVSQVPAGQPGPKAGVTRRETARGMTLNLSGDVLFASGADRLRPEAAEGLDEVAGLIRDLRPSSLRIMGHTDSVGDEAMNRDLSLRRARAVQRWLEERVGANAMPAVVVEGRGEAEPVGPNETAEGRAQNRRVEFLLER